MEQFDKQIDPAIPRVYLNFAERSLQMWINPPEADKARE